MGDFILTNGSRLLGEKWSTDYIPEKIQMKCTKKRKKGKWIPQRPILDLIDLKPIMEKQWKYFEPAFRGVGVEGGREKCLAWMDKLNEIRTMGAHPLKMHLARHRHFLQRTARFQVQWHALVLKLKKSRIATYKPAMRFIMRL